MFSVTQKANIKPFLHAFTPGVRASERGLLYRNTNMNAYSRIAPIDFLQQTTREARIRRRLNSPEGIYYLDVALLSVIIGFPIYLYGNRYSFKPLNSYGSGAVDEFERYERAGEMQTVIDHHRNAIANTRSEITELDVFKPVGEYSRPADQPQKV